MVNQVYSSTIISNIITFATGTSLTWSSPVMVKINDNGTTPFGRVPTCDECSWIVSLLALGAVLGPLVFAFAADKFGRKIALLSLAVPFLVSYIVLAFAKIVVLYYIARTMIGLAVGGVFTVIPMYVGEISETSNRGALGCLLNVLLSVGIMFSYCVGAFVSILTFNLILAVFPAIYMVLFFLLVPESPSYLVRTGEMETAAESLAKVRDESNDNAAELQEIKRGLEKESGGGVKDLFKSKGVIKALIISLTLVLIQQLSGVNAILFYAEAIFDASGSNLEPKYASMIIGGVQLISSFSTPLVIDRLGRKILLLSSTSGMLISEIPLGVYFFMKNNGKNVSFISWIPVACLVLYIITYNLGMGPLPWVVMGEIFPSNVKALASSLTAMFCWFLAFLLTKFFQSVAEAIGMGPSFWMFACFCGLGFLFILFFVIETRGKTVQEVQEILEA